MQKVNMMLNNTVNAEKDLVMVRALGCQWLGTNPSGVYCGSKDLVVGQCYCKDHWPLMFQKGTALRNRKKDIRRANAIWDWESDFNAAVQELEAEGVI